MQPFHLLQNSNYIWILMSRSSIFKMNILPQPPKQWFAEGRAWHIYVYEYIYIYMYLDMSDSAIHDPYGQACTPISCSLISRSLNSAFWTSVRFGNNGITNIKKGSLVHLSNIEMDTISDKVHGLVIYIKMVCASDVIFCHAAIVHDAAEFLLNPMW